MGEETTIMGTVLSVVFQNEENGYAVLRLVTDDGELLTLVGCVPCAAPGENLTATGSFSSHPQYGEQFSASEVERYLPSNETEILNYLASGVVRGVGPATAEKLVARFGIETLQVLESEPEKLTAIKGMTARRAQEISAAFNEQMGLRRVMEFLAHYDLPAALSVPLYRRFGANAMAALERNPYLLSDSAFGVDFSVCDEIALSMGFGGDASLRTEAGLLFELSHNRDAGGHVFLPREKLLAATAQLLDCDVDAVEKSLDDLIAIHRIVQEGVANVTACYLRQSWEDETYVVTRIEAMLADKPDALRGVERVIKEIEREQGVQYAPLQRRAVELAAKEELLLLTGGPGTGKTTSVRAIVALVKYAMNDKPFFQKVRYKAPLHAAFFLLLTAYDYLTLKTGILDQPFIPCLNSILNIAWEDREMLIVSTLYTLRLLFTGYFIGSFFGLITGIQQTDALLGRPYY